MKEVDIVNEKHQIIRNINISNDLLSNMKSNLENIHNELESLVTAQNKSNNNLNEHIEKEMKNLAVEIGNVQKH